jgi:hypothetical protein
MKTYTLSTKKDQAIASPFFHGTLAEFIPGIMAGGIKCQPEEPCFTKNLILACCRYANRGRNSNHIYSGKIFTDVETLIQQGLVNPREKKELLLEETREYWDKNDNSSAVFVFFPWNLVPGPPAAAHLAFDHQNKLVSGGITKWLEGHTALYRNQTNNKKQKNNQKFLQEGPGGAVFSKRGVAPPTHSRSARCRSSGASSQKFAENTKFHKVLVKSAPLVYFLYSFPIDQALPIDSFKFQKRLSSMLSISGFETARSTLPFSSRYFSSL